MLAIPSVDTRPNTQCFIVSFLISHEHSPFVLFRIILLDGLTLLIQYTPGIFFSPCRSIDFSFFKQAFPIESYLVLKIFHLLLSYSSHLWWLSSQCYWKIRYFILLKFKLLFISGYCYRQHRPRIRYTLPLYYWRTMYRWFIKISTILHFLILHAH